MKKIISFILIMVVSCATLTGCSDPVADALEQFTSKDMATATADYKAFAGDLGKLNSYTDADKAIAYCNDTLIKDLDKISTEVDKISVEEEKIKGLKSSFLEAISLYKQGVTQYVEALQKNSKDTLSKASQSFSSGDNKIGEYNKSLQSLCEEYGLEYQDAQY